VKIEATKERNILIGLIVSTQYTHAVSSFLKVGLLKSSYSRKVAGWCLDYFKRYEEAPGKVIQDILNAERHRLDENEHTAIEKLLVSVSKQVERLDKFDLPYFVDEAELYMRELQLEDHIALVRADLEDNEIARAESRISAFERVSKNSGVGFDLFEDDDLIRRSCVTDIDYLFSWTGALGEMVGSFNRGDFVGVAGPPGRGKSYWLQEIGMTAITERCSVLFVSLEMTETQMIRRIGMYLTGKTFPKSRYLKVPKRFAEDGSIEYFYEREWTALSAEDFLEARGFLKREVGGQSMKMLVYPQDSFNVEDLKVELENLEHFDGFLPDVIIIDYADIMKAEYDSPKDYRHRLDKTWKALRGLAQERNCLVVTATQTGRDTIKMDAGADNISEDIRKMNHVSKLIGLNQSEEEKEAGIVRISVWKDRHDMFLPGRPVEVLQSLAIGKVVIDSRVKKIVTRRRDRNGSK
jgi:hypothetical protein